MKKTKVALESFKKRFRPGSYEAIMTLKNPALHAFVKHYIELCNPSSIFVRTDSPADSEYIRKKAAENGEETALAVSGHTFHFDGYSDQARDKGNTKFLLPKGVNLGPHINSADRDQGLKEIHGYFSNIMDGKEAHICFFCLGPTNSPFSIPAVQITDSCYVAHSEDILYRPGYEEFKRLGASEGFFKFAHSAGKLDGCVSKNVDKRRIYIDLQEDTVLSVNTQYAGNTVGLKKLALRLAIQRASREDWLAEHMLVMGVHGPGNRLTYLTGAFPSACGKTSTAMLAGEKIVGDDIAYIRKIGGKVCAANVERGIFGIIRDVNTDDDPLIWKALTTPGEVIFSNVLIKDKTPCWLGDGRGIPDNGINYSGEWKKGNKDLKGNEITHSHRNARYTVRLKDLENCDPKLDAPDGVEVKGFVYGGRDSNTSVPVKQAFDWSHGILTMGAMLESETTAATLGKAGVRKFNLMSNLDFVSVTLGAYLKRNIDFVKGVDKPPAVFAVNYFLKGEKGEYLNGMLDKHVWVKWMELRVNSDVNAIKTPTGYIPEYTDLKRLFKELLDKEYAEQDYERQFTLRIPENLAKIERILGIYKRDVADTPPLLFDVLSEQKKRLLAVKEKYGDYVTPNVLA